MSRSEIVGSLKVEKEVLPTRVSEYFGCNVFTEAVMQNVLSAKTFKAFKTWQEGGAVIEKSQADEIANAMKEWALSKGANSYTHWFHPMTGLTAEKHDSFLDVNGPLQVLEKFSGGKLIQGEPDASSFPSGGIRATFEARGYTAWDPSSPAFITEVENVKTFTIPTIFISYTGEALDKKLPLLRSDAAINKAAVELLHSLGKTNVSKIISTCGPEQEYFLIDEAFYNKRPDLVMTTRTLLGAPSPKGQQLEDQYFGSIKDRVLCYMNDLSEECWKLGIPITTRHNEVAPHQFEFAPIFESSNLAADHNAILMDVMKRVAHRHGLACLMHEKPFAGVNGSGKHVNWSLSDDSGANLLSPGDTPEDNIQFMAILTSVIKAVHDYSDILRATAASAGNEHRLGANEAPPAIISIFLGEQLTKAIDILESGAKKKLLKKDLMDLGVHLLPKFAKDATDRNRTSPFAFTGNKFEFRAIGSSMNIATSVTVINTIVADTMTDIAARIRKVSKKADAQSAVMEILAEIIKDTRKVCFEGNGYSQEWVAEAAKRGLPNVASTAEALKAYITKKSIALFERHGVFSKRELLSRYEIWLDIYEKMIDIEARTLSEMVTTLVLPDAYSYQTEIGESLSVLKDVAEDNSIALPVGCLDDRKELFSKISADIFYIRRNTKELNEMLKKAHHMELEKKCKYLFEEVKEQMQHIRKHVDDLETLMPDELWQLPKYREMLFIM